MAYAKYWIFFNVQFVIAKIRKVIFIYLIRKADNHSLKVGFFPSVRQMYFSSRLHTIYTFAVIFASVINTYFFLGGNLQVAGD